MNVTTTTPMTAADLYQTDSTFRRAIDEWVENRRCDLRLVDYLIELDMVNQAEACRWAATEPERPAYESEELCGPMPTYDYSTDGHYDPYWYWMTISYSDVVESDNVPFGRVPKTTEFNFCHTAQLAILWLLDNWRIREGSK